MQGHGNPQFVYVQNKGLGKKKIIIIVLSILFPIVLTGGILAVVFGGLFFGPKTMDEYKCAMSEIRKNKEAIEFLGEPMEESIYLIPNISVGGSVRDVNFSMTMYGPKNSGSLTVRSFRDPFRSMMSIKLEADDKVLDIYNGEYPCG